MSVPPRDADSQAGLTHRKGRQGHQDQPCTVTLVHMTQDAQKIGPKWLQVTASHFQAKPSRCCSELSPLLSTAEVWQLLPLRGGQPPQSKSCLRPRPSAVPSISHPLSHSPPLAGTSPNLLLYEAVGSPCQVTGMAESLLFQNASCCPCPRSEAALASACHPSARAELLGRLWHPLRLHH